MAEVTIEDVVRAAWTATRSESAALYDELIPEYRANLVAEAEAVLAGTYPREPWEAFGKQVCQLADGRGNMQVGSELPDDDDDETPKKAAKKTIKVVKPVAKKK